MTVVPSPDSAKELILPADVTPIDLAASPNGPDVALLARDRANKFRVVAWKAGDDHTSAVGDLPDGFSARAIVNHPARASLFVSGSIAGKSQILSLTRDGATWRSAVVFESPREIGRLVIGPRPFSTSDSARYRLFFAATLADGSSSLRSVTENGKIEYQVAGPKSEIVNVKDAELQPDGPTVPSAIPLGVHPHGEPLLWQDRRGCMHALGYGETNWSADSTRSAFPCDGSLSITPNGTSYLHWQSGQPGVAVIREDGHAIGRQATAFTFVAPPVSTPDGKGVIGLVSRSGGHTALVYSPISVPLGDVANAWQLARNACEEHLLTKNGGLFLDGGSHQELFSIYETNSYQNDVPPPYLVTTDLFWENFGAAYNGVFIVLERRRALPAFWAFVDAANTALASKDSTSMWARGFAALAGMHRGVTTGEAGRVAHDSGGESSVFGSELKFAELMPRSHYTTTPEMREYFRAVHYLTEAGRVQDPATLAGLPPDVQRKALDWIDVYAGFIAPSRAKLIWSGEKPSSLAPFALHPWDHATVFPLSWGVDNETLESSVYHSKWPPNEQIAGPPGGQRSLASGLDLATVFGSSYARSLLAPDFAAYPRFGPVLDGITARRPVMSASSNLYDRWLDALGAEWADSAGFPGAPKASPVWSAKRLQTGLASWATLREATILVNERPSGVEGGEGGFEELIPEIPRGYVEPAPKTFEAIATLFDALDRRVTGASDFGTAGAVKGEDNEWRKDEPLRQGIGRRLIESAATVRRFKVMAEKELRGEALADSEYAAIRDVGGIAEHQFLVYKSLGQKDLAIGIPEPLPKIADVAGDLDRGLLEAAVGGPLVWRQIAPFFGRRQIVLGSTYSYYEFKSMTLYDNERWRKEIDTHARPAWIQALIAPSGKSCRADASR
ncbi:MAG TPA: DUF3160 domain-containing protein, partial [Gemmatimonadaceae bacterium]|nr:DUF3160 domain-containing protein [Gemmatimonadaceae bacterium]